MGWLKIEDVIAGRLLWLYMGIWDVVLLVDGAHIPFKLFDDQIVLFSMV